MSIISPVFRARGIPLDADLSKIITTLREAYPGFSVNRDACAIVPSPYTSTTDKTALIQFFRTPPALERLGAPGQKDSVLIDYRRPGMVQLIIDKEFYELTQLYEPKPLPITADIVAVSGLNGHAYGSWRSKGGQSMWLRDFLSKDLPSCRTMIFGCNTKLSDDSDYEISDYAATLLGELKKARRTTEEKARPIVFIGHSFGGVIIAQAIVKAHSDAQDICGWKNIFDNTRAIALFGTPHQGFYLDDLQGMLKEGSPRKRLLDALKSGSSQLREELSKFVNCCDNIKIITFYEVKQTKTVVTSPDGVSTASGNPRMRVDRDSAILRLPSKTEQVHVADGDHSDIVKFKHSQERSYLSFLNHFRDFDLSPRNVTGSSQAQKPATPAPATPAPATPAPATPAPATPAPATPVQATPAPTPTPAPAHSTPAPTPPQPRPPPSTPLRTSPPPIPTFPQGPDIPGLSSTLSSVSIGAGSTPKHGIALDAVLSNDPSALRGILHQTPGVVNQRQWNNTTTLLHIAIDHGFESVAHVLLDYAVNLDARDQNGLSALRVAAYKGLSGIVRAIIARQGQAHNCEERGWALISASTQGHLGTTQVLLESEVSLEWLSPKGDGIRALHAAAIGGHVPVVRLLVQYGAVIHAVETQGRNALHLAVINNKLDVVRELIPVHIGRRICLDIPDRCGYSALHLAASMGHQAVAEALLENGATIEIKGPDGNTPLGLAAGSGHKGMVSLLLARGAEVNMVDHRRTTPLSLASRSGHVEVVEELLGRGASIDLVDLFNNSAIYYATAGGHMKVVEILSIARQQRIGQPAQRAPGLQAQGHVSILGFGLSFGAQNSYWP